MGTGTAAAYRGRPGGRRAPGGRQYLARVMVHHPVLGPEHGLHGVDVLGGTSPERGGLGTRAPKMVGATCCDHAHSVLLHDRRPGRTPRLPEVRPPRGEEV